MRMTEPFAVIFDFDGVLLDSETPEFEAHVRLFAASLDSLTESTMLCEVAAIDPNALSTLRTVLAATEAIAEMRDAKNTAGMTALRHMVDDARVTVRLTGVAG